MRNRIMRCGLVALAVTLGGMAAGPLMASSAGPGIIIPLGIFNCCEGEDCILDGCWVPINLCQDSGDCGLG